MVIKDLQFLLKYRDDVGKIFVIGLIYVLWISLAVLVTEMVPIRGRNGEFDIVVVLLWQDILEVLQLLDMGLGCRRVVPNLTRADYCLTRLVIFLKTISRDFLTKYGKIQGINQNCAKSLVNCN